MMGQAEPARRPILCVVGARPNYMKMAPLLHAMQNSPLQPILIHTGQHYDAEMNEQFFTALELPRPEINLGVGSGTHAAQTAEVMKRFEPVVERYAPAAVLVVGDVNSTLACALVAAKMNVPLVHVEAGLRSYDRSMPEEINRVLTDQIADLLYTTERAANDNLRREGVAAERIVFAGNVMIDSLMTHRAHAVPALQTLAAVSVKAAEVCARGYGLVTLHRPSNVDDQTVLQGLLATLIEVSAALPLVLTLHPRTQHNIRSFGLQATLDAALQSGRMLVLPPQGYFEMLGLMSTATLVLTDSGGIQDETTALGVPCLTLRHNTERPITLHQGSNQLVGQDHQRIMQAVAATLSGQGNRGRMPEFWDGQAALRIVRHLADWLAVRDHVSTSVAADASANSSARHKLKAA